MVKTDNKRIPPYLLGIAGVFIIIVFVLILRACTRPSEAERARMTAEAIATQGFQDTRIAALTNIPISQTQTAMPTPTPPPPWVCLGRGHFMGMSAVLEPFEVNFDPAYAYEYCELDETGIEELCSKRIVMEKGEYGPIIPSEDIWIIIPGVEEAKCDDARGKWVMDVSGMAPVGNP